MPESFLKLTEEHLQEMVTKNVHDPAPAAALGMV